MNTQRTLLPSNHYEEILNQTSVVMNGMDDIAEKGTPEMQMQQQAANVPFVLLHTIASLLLDIRDINIANAQRAGSIKGTGGIILA